MADIEADALVFAMGIEGDKRIVPAHSTIHIDRRYGWGFPMGDAEAAIRGDKPLYVSIEVPYENPFGEPDFCVYTYRYVSKNGSLAIIGSRIKQGDDKK